MRNSRPTMEDRITACASFVDAEQNKNSLMNLSDVSADEIFMPPPPPMIGGEHFFEVLNCLNVIVCLIVIITVSVIIVVLVIVIAIASTI
jgi:hypothetical protein